MPSPETQGACGRLFLSKPWLIAFAGEAGTGKSTLSRALGQRLRWPVIDKDDINDIVYGHTQEPNSGPLAYDAMFNVARRQLLLGLSVICDSPLTGQIGYEHAASIAQETGATLALVECRCPNDAVWRDRINLRKSLNLPAHHQTDWDKMQRHASQTNSARLIRDEHLYLMVDTLVPVDVLCRRIVAWLEREGAEGTAG